jgi:hypothetical protein
MVISLCDFSHDRDIAIFEGLYQRITARSSLIYSGADAASPVHFCWHPLNLLSKDQGLKVADVTQI